MSDSNTEAIEPDENPHGEGDYGPPPAGYEPTEEELAAAAELAEGDVKEATRG